MKGRSGREDVWAKVSEGVAVSPVNGSVWVASFEHAQVSASLAGRRGAEAA